jgi:hypothetical protein
MQRYVDEYAYRFNNKKEDLGTIFLDLVTRVSNSNQLSHKSLTKGVV